MSKLKGIVSVNVSLSTSKGKVEYCISECGPRDVIEAINVCLEGFLDGLSLYFDRTLGSMPLSVTARIPAMSPLTISHI